MKRNLAVLFCIVTPAMAQTRLFTVEDENGKGTRVKSPMWLGDINGDKCDDFALAGGGVYYRTVTVFSGTDGQVLHSFSGAGGSVLGGDIDGDGIPEILSASSNSVWVISGKTGQRLKIIPAFSTSWTFGSSLANAGDVDKDGVPDVLVGDWDGSPGHESGRAWVFSGKTGKMILAVSGTMQHERLGSLVAPAGDVNKDGYADIATNGGVAQVFVFSGKDGTKLRTYATGWPLEIRGADMDGDEKIDVIVRARTQVRVYSGATAKLKYLAAMTEEVHAMGLLPDLDGDGHRDIALGYATVHTTGGLYSGRVDVINSNGKTVRFSMKGETANAGRGAFLAGGGDANGDGVGDLLVGNLGFKANNYVYTFEVRSMEKLTLAVDVHEVSITTRTTQTMTLDAGMTHAGKSYFMIGSVLGTHPGFKYQGFTIPLNPGPYFNATIFGGVPMLANAMGTLDAAGKAKVTFRMPVGWPISMAGIRAHHSYVVFDNSFNLVMVSPAVPVTPTR